MSVKSKKPDEFQAMAKLYEVLKPFDTAARQRMVVSVEEKIAAEAPKKRVRKPKQHSNGAIVIEPVRVAEH